MVDILNIIAESPAIPIPIAMLLLVFGIMFIALIILIVYLLDLKRFGKEGFIFAKARKKNLPVLCVVDIGSNHAKYELGTKKKNDDIEYNNELSGVQVDPSLTTGGAVPTRFEKGLNIYNFSTIDWLPITNSNALAYQSIKKWKEKHKEYDFLTLIEFTTLISTPKHHLSHDIQTYISNKKPTYKYEENGKIYEAEYEVDDIIPLIDNAREAISTLPIVPGFFSFNQAFENIPQAYSAQDLELLKILIRKQIEQEWMKKINIMLYAVASSIIFLAAGVSVYIVSRAGG